MFSLFLNDIELHLQENIEVVIDIYQIAVYLLLFDDAATHFRHKGRFTKGTRQFEYCCN